MRQGREDPVEACSSVVYEAVKCLSTRDNLSHTLTSQPTMINILAKEESGLRSLLQRCIVYQ
jgi:hypothetical protein